MFPTEHLVYNTPRKCKVTNSVSCWLHPLFCQHAITYIVVWCISAPWLLNERGQQKIRVSNCQNGYGWLIYHRVKGLSAFEREYNVPGCQNAKSQLRDFTTASSTPVMVCLFMSSPDGLHDDTISNFHLLMPRHMEISYLEITSVVYREWTLCCGHIQSPLSTINTMKVNAQAV